MKNKKSFSTALLTFLSLALLTGCGGNNEETSEEPKPLEVGDTVKEWTSSRDLEEAPLAIVKNNQSGSGYGDLVDNFGNEDDDSIYYELNEGARDSFIGSDGLATPYFAEDDAKNGDVLSLFF